jgi:AcrR family transcriptional regulator
LTSIPSSKSSRDCRETLLGVAGEIFAERGYEAATIKEITDRAGVNVASVNYYFRDKLSLYIEVLRQGLHNWRLALPRNAPPSPGGASHPLHPELHADPSSPSGRPVGADG